MPAPLSVDLRQRIIAAYEAKEGSQRQLAEGFWRELVVHSRFEATATENGQRGA
jgi:hypothetical protein